ncbi:hypothetical protein CF319_g1841 [Tilletia indica]|nr:hypothetical protein CF319_g1841 [Tilletia indica]
MPPSWIPTFRNEQHLFNPILGIFKLIGDITESVPATLELKQQGPAAELAGIIHYGAVARRDPRSIYVHKQTEQGPTRVSPQHDLYDALCYPMLFPQGTPTSVSKPWTLRKIAKHRILTEPRFQNFWKVANLYMLDVVCRMEEARLDFISQSLTALRRGNTLPPQQHEIDEHGIEHDDNDYEHDHSQAHPILPSSFVGSRAYRAEQVSDALALSSRHGRPHGMITLTSNPEWPELKRFLRRDQTATTVPQLTTRVFSARLSRFMKEFNRHFGKVMYIVKVIEFQKRGLPHAHIIFCVHPELPISAIDNIVSAEVPPPEKARLRELILRFMIHPDDHINKRDGTLNNSSRCQKDGQCIYGFPHPVNPTTYLDPYTQRVVYRRRSEEDSMVAQYSPVLLLLWHGHCHIDIAISHHTFVYMFKYVSKGPDYAEYRIRESNGNATTQTTSSTNCEHEANTQAEEDIVRVGDDYIRARYLSATEACWRIFGFPMTHKSPSVQRLSVHDIQENRPQFGGLRGARSSASSLKRYFLRPEQWSDHKYIDYYEQTISCPSTQSQRNDPSLIPQGFHLERSEHGLNFTPNLISARQTGSKVARIKTIRPSAGNAYYIRQLLLHRPARSWNDLRRSPDGTIHPTFRQAAEHEGLIQADDEPVLTLQEAVTLHTAPSDLRFLLCLLTHEGAPATKLWDTFCDALSRDFLPYNHTFTNAPEQSVKQAHQAALNHIDDTLHSFGLSNAGIGLPPAQQRQNLTDAEQAYFQSRQGQLRAEAASAYSRFSDEQKQIYDTILSSVTAPTEHTHRLHLIQGRAGRGKTFLLKAIINNLRGYGHLIAICGATGLSASTFEKGTTVHKRFSIPIVDDEDEQEHMLQSTMRSNSPTAAFLRAMDVLIIDEVWALPRAVLEAVDRLLRTLLQVDLPFGGKSFIGIGDPRQTAPVTRENTKQATLENSFLYSNLFPLITIHELSTSQRQADDPEFSAWIDHVGDDSNNHNIDLSNFFQNSPTIEDAISFLFPPNVLEQPHLAVQRCFLSPLNLSIDQMNAEILKRLLGTLRKDIHMLTSKHSSLYHGLPNHTSSFPTDTMTARDAIKDGENANDLDIQTALDTLAEIPHTGIPGKELQLKNGQICSLLRNINVNEGLIKHARIVIDRINTRSITIRLLATNRTYTLPRITFTFTPRTSPFKIIRQQFPLRSAYASTFHSCQGLTLDRTIIDCTTPIFAHGQRYAAISRTRNRSNTRIYTPLNVSSIVNNIVFPEFVNLPNQAAQPTHGS